MADLRFPEVMILAPPFLSHLNPLLELGRGLAGLGTKVTVGCAPDFQEDISGAGLQFTEVAINRNANSGVATETNQASQEQLRLKEFLEATARGPVETLITQARHRTDDMLANPEDLAQRIVEIRKSLHPALWIVDQLSYGCTLALHGLGEPFVTFCAPHPLSIPGPGQIYSVPPRWPSVLEPSRSDLAALKKIAREVEISFTGKFNALLKTLFGCPPVESAFGLTSPRAVIYNYPPFKSEEPRQIFAGHSYREQDLEQTWRDRLDAGSPRVLLALGTFLASRGDVLRQVIEGLPGEAVVFVGAGGSVQELAGLASDRVRIERFLPQRGLLPHVDLVIHHGGVSSFTETLYTGKPMIVMPFSSDQFNVARDVQDYRLGSVLDPNRITGADLRAAVADLGRREIQDAVGHWSGVVRERGPGFAARRLQTGG